MIEIRIPFIEACEYSNSESFGAFVKGKMIAGGVPLDSGPLFTFLRAGFLECCGQDVRLNVYIWRWYEEDEYTGATLQ